MTVINFWKGALWRAIKRGFRAAVALWASGFMVSLAEEPALILLAPVILAADKILRDWLGTR